MKRLIVLSALAVGLMTSACVTVIDADGDGHINWTGENAQPFDASREGCRQTAGNHESSRAFEVCMAAKGWRRG
jgi:hypothetical protein